MKAYVAVQRKLLTIIYALFKANTPFVSDFLATQLNQNQATETVQIQGS